MIKKGGRQNGARLLARFIQKSRLLNKKYFDRL